ncbi:hypothetical protein Cgig2_023551 [Carnegiea gigantea]|uniref:Uncharacterized protein n=1 Tax=Carnegiea gigantea TaxID=171969 RepID=A0A9Q1JZ02_9CARY|nr:hypothetical protein Cgig2_023551 [Carnegiea gigantea]
MERCFPPKGAIPISNLPHQIEIKACRFGVVNPKKKRSRSTVPIPESLRLRPLCCGAAASLRCNSIESRLLSSSSSVGQGEESGCVNDEDAVDLGSSTQFNVLMKLCSGEDDFRPQEDNTRVDNSMLQCPLCGIDISQWDEESRLSHANACLDKSDAPSVSGSSLLLMPADSYFVYFAANVPPIVHSRISTLNVFHVTLSRPMDLANNLGCMNDLGAFDPLVVKTSSG